MSGSYLKHLTIEEELNWYETKIDQIKSYLEERDLSKLKDRTGLKESPKGGAYPVVVASIEVQAKSFMDLMEKLPKLYFQLDELRNKYAEKQIIGRGKVETKGTGLEFLNK